jgi:hypothetical protein
VVEDKKVKDKEFEEERKKLVEERKIENESIESKANSIHEKFKADLDKLEADWKSDYEELEEEQSEISEDSEIYILATKVVKQDMENFLHLIEDKINDGNEESLDILVEKTARLTADMIRYLEYCNSAECYENYIKPEELNEFIIRKLNQLCFSNDPSLDVLSIFKYSILFKKFIHSALDYYMEKYKIKKGIEKIFTIEIVEKLFDELRDYQDNKSVKRAVQELNIEPCILDILRLSTWLGNKEIIILTRNIFIRLEVDNNLTIKKET